MLALLKADEPPDAIRHRLLEEINRLHFSTYDEGDDIHDLDRVIVRDCARVWRGLLHPRSERLAGFSLLRALTDAARGIERPELSPAFWADVTHLIRGVEGQVRPHEVGSVEIDDSLVGREAGRERSRILDGLGARAEARMQGFRDGLLLSVRRRRRSHRAAIVRSLSSPTTAWNDWRWQMRNVCRTPDALGRLASLSQDEHARIAGALQVGMPFAVTPYYASLFDRDSSGQFDLALRMQVIPPQTAVDLGESADDFMAETDTSPVDRVTRRYVGVAIFKPFNACAQICVYCQRNWEVKNSLAPDALILRGPLDEAVRWFADHPHIREVLITGGDPLLMPDDRLGGLLRRFAEIPHIERIRIGTRTPVVLPMRFTPALCALLGSLRKPGTREVAIVTHVQHPYEVTPELVRAVERLRRRGMGVYNQLVYTFFVSRRFEAAALRRVLRRVGIDPYYTFYPKAKKELDEYRVPLARILQERKEEARLLPGLERTDAPVYNVPGLGKTNLNAWQHRDLISIRPNGARIYEFHPWEKKIAPQRTYVGDDMPILDYLDRLRTLGEAPEDYESIWFYF